MNVTRCGRYKKIRNPEATKKFIVFFFFFSSFEKAKVNNGITFEVKFIFSIGKKKKKKKKKDRVHLTT